MTDESGPDQGFASMCPKCGRGLVSAGEWCCGGWTPDAVTEQGRQLASQREDLIAQGVNPRDLLVPVNWDSPLWGQPGHNVHHATTDDLGDHGRHADETNEDD